LPRAGASRGEGDHGPQIAGKWTDLLPCEADGEQRMGILRDGTIERQDRLLNRAAEYAVLDRREEPAPHAFQADHGQLITLSQARKSPASASSHR
jgi:hypothetical protein